MDRVEKTVFLSYRRTNWPLAIAVYQNLKEHNYDVFFDYSGIASGDFEQVILANILSRAHFIVLLTPSALERCSDPDDWVRREIEAALESQRNIVPLILDGFDFGSPAIESELTGKLAYLKSYNGLRIPPEYFEEAMERLRTRFLNVPLSAVLHPAGIAAQEAAAQQQNAAATAPVVAKEELTAQQWFERGYVESDTDQKIRFYTEAIHLKPDFRDAFYNRGRALCDKSDWAAAIQDYDETVRLSSQSWYVFGNRALARYHNGNIDGAIEDCTEAIRLKPDYARGFNLRGNARYDKGDKSGAIEDFNQALQLKPDYVNAFINRGNARYDNGDTDGAINDYTEAIRLDKNGFLAYSNRGNARFKKGDNAGAYQDYTEAIRLNPNDPLPFTNRGNFRYAKGDIKGANKDFAEANRLKLARQ